MNRLNLVKKLSVIAFIFLFANCSKDDGGGVNPDPVLKSKYVVAFQENAVGDASSVDYVLDLASLEDLTTGEIDVKGKGITQTGWRFFHQADNTLFTAGYSDDVTCNSYVVNEEGNLVEKASFTFEKTLDSYATTEDGKMIAVELSYGGLGKKRFHIVNATTGKVERIVEHEVDIDQGNGTAENPGSIPWVTGMVQRDNQLFVSYHKWSADGKYVTPDTDRAYVAIFKYPEFELEKIIYDNRTSPVGVNGHNTGVLKTENGDIYTYSSSALSAGFTAASKPSAILRIKNGTTEFDNDYFFNVETPANGGKVFWMDYVGNGKAIARIILDDTVGAYEWGAFLRPDVFKMVIIDFNAKTVTDVQGIPSPHGQRYTSRAYVEDGKAYMSISDATETRIYVVDPATATSVKGAKVTNAKSLKGIFKLTEEK